MNTVLAANLALLAQGYDDTGAANRSSMVPRVSDKSKALPMPPVVELLGDNNEGGRKSEGSANPEPGPTAPPGPEIGL
jgi:hypothetical protein